MTLSREKTYVAWRKIIGACTDRLHPWYPRYGAVGATVCSQWTQNYRRFMEDMGAPNPGQTRVERLDEEKPFEPGNCRWAFPIMGCRPGPQKPRNKSPDSRDWANMTRLTVYLDKTLVAKILSEAAHLGELERRRISLPTLVRETIEKTFGGAA